MVKLSMRMTLSQLGEIDRLAKTRGLDRSTMIRALLDQGIKETRLRAALDLVRDHKASVWRAARTAGTDYRTMLAAVSYTHLTLPTICSV